MYRRNHFMFRGIAGIFMVFVLVAMLFGVFRMGITRGMMTPGAGSEMPLHPQFAMDGNALLIFFGGILAIMVVGFILKLIFWKLVGEKRFEQFAEMRKDHPRRAYSRGGHMPRHFWHHGCYEDEFERPVKNVEESPRSEEE